MPGPAPEDDASDSRTASVGFSQTRGRKAAQGASQNSVKSRFKKNAAQAREFSNSILADDHESQRSSDSIVTDEDQFAEPTAPWHSQAPTGGIQPSVSWNKSDRGAIRTKLRSSGTGKLAATPNTSFEEVNSTYRQSRSSSVSNSGHGDQPAGEESRTQKRGDSQSRPHIVINSSSDSEAGEVTEGEDTMVLNMGSVGHAGESAHASYETEHEGEGAHETQDGEKMGNVSQKHSAHDSAKSSNDLANARGLKEAAMRAFNDKYRSDPQTLANLHREDLELQAKYIFYNVAIDELDLRRPITCMDCFKEGHLADVCPDKECVHCGAWGIHESRFCPTWRRCQKCRERGHDEVDCSTSFRELSSEVSCDLCSSTQHRERDCDMTWKTPASQSKSGPIFISVSCAYCVSAQHLIGDCPRRPFPISSSSWTLKTYDPSMVNSLSSSSKLNGPNTAINLDRPQYAIRGRATERISSPDSDDALSRFGHSAPTKRGRPNAHIRFDAGIGRGRSSGNSVSRQSSGRGDRFAADGDRRSYRDRDQYFDHNTRQRSLSPMPLRSGRGARENRQPRRSPPYDSQQSAPRGRSRGRVAPTPRGRGRPRSPPDRDTYRPMPSAGKKAWSKFRS